MKSDVKVAVVVPIVSQFQLAIEALNSVRTEYDWEPYIIDNWRENKGCSWAWNTGTRLAIARNCSHILIINDDILIAPHAIDRLIENWPEEYILLGLTHHNDISVIDDPHQFDESPDFSAFMIKPETIDVVGWFDENFTPAYFEDNDYHRRINLAGRKGGRYHPAAHHHYKSRTQFANPNSPLISNDAFSKNAQYYQDKWGGGPGNETFDHPFNDPKQSLKDWERKA